MRDHIAEDGAFEPFDALLEEVLREDPVVPAAIATPHRAGWLLAAAVLLLGVGAVTGTVLTSRSSPSEPLRAAPPAGLSSPQDPERMDAPADLDGWRYFLPRVRKVIVTCPRDVPAGAPRVDHVRDAQGRLRDVPVPYTRSSAITAAIDVERVPDSATIADEKQLAILRAAIVEAVEQAQQQDPPVITRSGTVAGLQCDLLLVTDDNRFLPAQVLIVDKGMIWWQGGVRNVVAPGDGLRLLQQAARDAQRHGRSARGEAASIDELRALPASTRAIRCPCLTAAQARAELPRFRELTRLTFAAPAAPELPMHGEVVAAIAALPGLRALSLPGSRLDAEDLRTLGRSGTLQDLELSRCHPDEVAGGIRALASSLRTLRLHLANDLETLALPQPERQARQRARAAGMVALGEAIVGLSRLQSLDLGNSGELGDRFLRWIVLTKVDQLCLDDTAVTAQQVAMLAGLPSLRVLSLRDTELGDAAGDPLAKLQQVRRLDLTGSKVTDIGFASVRSDLPRCEVIGQPVVRVFYDDGQDGAAQRGARMPIATSDR